jgi:hypothetical protein
VSGGSQDVVVQFAPTSTTGYGGTITVNADQTGGTPTIAVSGTGIPLPIAVTGAATFVTATGATLNGAVNPNGSATTARFDYGLTSSYGTQVSASPAPGSGTSLVAVNAVVTGLLPNTPYHFRVVATSGPSVNGLDQIFMTGAPTNAAPLFTAEPTSRFVTVGQTVAFTVAASGTPVPSYQWQQSVNGGASWTNLTEAAPYSGVNLPTLTVTSVTPALTRTQYRCIVANGVGSATSNTATLTFRTLDGDFDGDGKADITVFRPSTGTWFTQYSRTGTAAGFQWGNGNDVPVPGDYDGDGKTDIAVFRPSNGTWFIVNSSTGSAVGIQWGNGNDVTVPGDYDGDGKTDIAVFRPSNGTWFIKYSGSGTMAGIQWGNASDIPILKR